jgi:PhoPQ-activated pathogenicity-related protein
MFPILCALSFSSQSPQDLHNYLVKSDPSFAVTSISTDAKGTTIQMTSQTWHGIAWRHSILLRQPANASAPNSSVKGTGILYITGDGPRNGDYVDIGLMSAATGMPVAMLFDIPNQPIWGMKEDDLIAHTFEEYLKTSDPTWPLLFPMAKSALRAMDTVEAATAKSTNPLHRFVVTGASKRGWTTWMVGAAQDPRVIGIAPMVYDNLNVGPQMSHQIQSWGTYSEMIQDYTRRGLQQKLSTPKGKVLARIVDPYSYRNDIHVPTLIVKGANDPYWTVDATSLYWNKLPQPHWLMVVPNAGHDLGGGISAAQTIGAFARSLAGQFNMPKVEASLDSPANGKEIRWSFVVPKSHSPKDATLVEVRLWAATSDSHDFRKSQWKQIDQVGFDATNPAHPGARTRRETPRPAGNVAAYIEFRFSFAGQSFSLCQPIKVLS